MSSSPSCCRHRHDIDLGWSLQLCFSIVLLGFVLCSMEFTVKCSMVEIYMEKIRDLLDTSRDNLQVKEDPGLGVYIAGCTEVYVTSIEECFDVMRQGGENRAVAATGMNEGSSRSHSLFIIFLSQKDSKSGTIKTGRFFLVDLAGTRTTSASTSQRVSGLAGMLMCRL